MNKITILGSGFGALTTIRELRRLKVEAEITVISPRDELHYLPSSIWIPTGLVNGEDLKSTHALLRAQGRTIHPGVGDRPGRRRPYRDHRCRPVSQ
jgi:sulfide:quinone oxidoreductase